MHSNDNVNVVESGWNEARIRVKISWEKIVHIPLVRRRSRVHSLAAEFGTTIYFVHKNKKFSIIIIH